jgi:small conductance mechanosensitive channel
MSNIWQQITESLWQYWHSTLAGAIGPLLTRLAAALVLGVVTWAVARFTGRTVRQGVQEATDEAEFALLAGRLAHLGVSGLGAGLVLSELGLNWAALAGFFGFFGLGLSLSFADILKSVIAGAYLLIERPYRLGYTIAVRGHEGTIEDMRLRTTNIRTADGRLVIVPNSIIMTDAVVSAAPTKKNPDSVA